MNHYSIQDIVCASLVFLEEYKKADWICYLSLIKKLPNMLVTEGKSEDTWRLMSPVDWLSFVLCA